MVIDSNKMDRVTEIYHIPTQKVAVSYYEGMSARSMIAIREFGNQEHKALGRWSDSSVYYYQGYTNDTCNYLYSFSDRMSDDDCVELELVRFDLRDPENTEEIILKDFTNSIQPNERVLPGEIVGAADDDTLLLVVSFLYENSGNWLVSLSLSDFSLTRISMND